MNFVRQMVFWNLSYKTVLRTELVSVIVDSITRVIIYRFIGSNKQIKTKRI